jgi:hypothetical protein
MRTHFVRLGPDGSTVKIGANLKRGMIGGAQHLVGLKLGAGTHREALNHLEAED